MRLAALVRPALAAVLLALFVSGCGAARERDYVVTAYFPEKTQLAPRSDVRIGGVSVGEVRDVRSEAGRTAADLVIDPEFAPISADARAILRSKTLLGETYVELISGDGPPSALPSGGEASIEGARRKQTSINEIYNALDRETREGFHRWQRRARIEISEPGRG